MASIVETARAAEERADSEDRASVLEEVLAECKDSELREALQLIADFLVTNAYTKARKHERERYDELLTDKLAEFQDEYAAEVGRLKAERE